MERRYRESRCRQGAWRRGHPIHFCLYWSLLHFNTLTTWDGRYIGFDGVIHSVASKHCTPISPISGHLLQALSPPTAGTPACALARK